MRWGVVIKGLQGRATGMLDHRQQRAGCRAGASPAPVGGEPWSWSSCAGRRPG